MDIVGYIVKNEKVKIFNLTSRGNSFYNDGVEFGNAKNGEKIIFMKKGTSDLLGSKMKFQEFSKHIKLARTPMLTVPSVATGSKAFLGIEFGDDSWAQCIRKEWDFEAFRVHWEGILTDMDVMFLTVITEFNSWDVKKHTLDASKQAFAKCNNFKPTGNGRPLDLDMTPSRFKMLRPYARISGLIKAKNYKNEGLYPDPALDSSCKVIGWTKEMVMNYESLRVDLTLSNSPKTELEKAVIKNRVLRTRSIMFDKAQGRKALTNLAGLLFATSMKGKPEGQNRDDEDDEDASEEELTDDNFASSEEEEIQELNVPAANLSQPKKEEVPKKNEGALASSSQPKDQMTQKKKKKKGRKG